MLHSIIHPGYPTYSYVIVWVLHCHANLMAKDGQYSSLCLAVFVVTMDQKFESTADEIQLTSPAHCLKPTKKYAKPEMKRRHAASVRRLLHFEQSLYASLPVRGDFIQTLLLGTKTADFLFQSIYVVFRPLPVVPINGNLVSDFGKE